MTIAGYKSSGPTEEGKSRTIQKGSGRQAAGAEGATEELAQEEGEGGPDGLNQRTTHRGSGTIMLGFTAYGFLILSFGKTMLRTTLLRQTRTR